MRLSIVTTLFRSEPYIDEFHRRMSAVALKISPDYELIMVNDGSPDRSLNKALQLQKTDPHLSIIDLSRNFGHHEAGMTGLEASLGDYIFLIDSDLEEAPELLEEFWESLNTDSQIDVVYGIQETRKGNWFKRHSGSFFYFIFNKLSAVNIPQNLLTVRLMRRDFVNSVIQYQEKQLFVAGIMAHAGFNQQAIPVQKLSKQQSSYTLNKQLKLFLTCITSFSSRPLEYVLLVGVIMLSLSVLVALILMIQNVFFTSSALSSTATISLIASFLTGIIVSCTGIVALYLGKIYDEVKQRPRTIIKTIYHGKKSDG